MKKNINQDCQKGFTLIELLLYVSILGAVMFVVSMMFLNMIRSQGTMDSRAEVNSNLRFALEKISQDVRSASAVSSPASASSTSASLVMTVFGTQVTYCASGGQIRRQTGGSCSGSSPEITSSKVMVDNLLFTRNENSNSILGLSLISITTDITVSASSTNPNKMFTLRRSSTTHLR